MRRAFVMMILPALVSCSPAPQPEPAPTLATSPVCEGGPGLPALQVTPRVTSLLEAPNALAPGDEHLWVVESFENTVSRFDPATARMDVGFIDVGNDHNPYDVAVDDDGLAWITNYGALANSVTVADARTGEVLAEITSEHFDNPSGVAVTARHVYVTSVEYVEAESRFGAGSIAVIDRATREVLGAFEASAPNPQFASVVETPDGPRVVIVSTGALARVGGVFKQVSAAGVEVLREAEDPLAPTRQFFALPAPPEGSNVGAPGRALATPDGARVYMTSATAPAIFSLDLVEGRWLRGAEDPILLYESAQETLHNGAMDARGLLWVLSFNQDALYIVDTRCDALLTGPIPLGQVEEELEGPIGIVVTDADAPRAYFVTSLSKALGSVAPAESP